MGTPFLLERVCGVETEREREGEKERCQWEDEKAREREKEHGGTHKNEREREKRDGYTLQCTSYLATRALRMLELIVRLGECGFTVTVETASHLPPSSTSVASLSPSFSPTLSPPEYPTHNDPSWPNAL